MKNNKVFYGWWLVLFSALSLAVMGPASVAVANLFQNPVTHEFGITNSQFAISNSLVLGMGIFLSPFISKKLAFGNFRLVYVVGVLIYGLAYIGFSFAPNMYVFYALALLVGVGN
ncbi:MAG: MFS transporter, partial [Lactobacillales bacterium]|nr:MFS transporter [Lactobacillales bacterium]